MTTEQDFIRRYNDVKEGVIRELDLALERAIGNKVVDLDKCEDNYTDVYPLVAAVLQNQVRQCLEGSSYDWRIRQQKKQATAYRNDYRIWRNYAGDHRGIVK